jgi:hypothetical protein
MKSSAPHFFYLCARKTTSRIFLYCSPCNDEGSIRRSFDHIHPKIETTPQFNEKYLGSFYAGHTSVTIYVVTLLVAAVPFPTAIAASAVFLTASIAATTAAKVAGASAARIFHKRFCSASVLFSNVIEQAAVDNQATVTALEQHPGKAVSHIHVGMVVHFLGVHGASADIGDTRKIDKDLVKANVFPHDVVVVHFCGPEPSI